MPAIALIGGSFLGAWAWERVTPTLAAAGHDVHPLTLTGFGDRAHLGSTETTLSTHATDIVAAIESAGLHDVVLVAHSYAGAPATIAASRIPNRLARVVYVAAVLPEPGKTLFETAPPGFEDMIAHLVETEGDGWRIPVMSDEIIDAHFGEHGLSPDDRAWLRARAVGQPVNTYRGRVPDDLGAADALPRTFIACAADPGDPPIAPGTPGWETMTIDTGHWPMITEPTALARLIDEAARHPAAGQSPAMAMR
jgi:pimeloyl-ACP methyl ester carboxylesterase